MYVVGLKAQHPINKRSPGHNTDGLGANAVCARSLSLMHNRLLRGGSLLAFQPLCVCACVQRRGMERRRLLQVVLTKVTPKWEHAEQSVCLAVGWQKPPKQQQGWRCCRDLRRQDVQQQKSSSTDVCKFVKSNMGVIVKRIIYYLILFFLFFFILGSSWSRSDLERFINNSWTGCDITVRHYFFTWIPAETLEAEWSFLSKLILSGPFTH